MANPTFNGFSLQDSNFITERIYFKPYAKRAITRAKINRREGVKVLGTEFGEKPITVEGVIIGSSPSNLQTLIDNMKSALTAEEGALIIEADRTFTATVEQLDVPDEHYNQSKAPFRVEFVCTNPFAEGSLLTATANVPSGVFTFSGLVNISGTLFSRPTITYTPPSNTGSTLIRRIDLSHTPTGQVVTISGLGSGAAGGLGYQNAVTINLDSFTTLDGSSAINNSGAFPRFEPGNNAYVLTASGRAFPGGTVTVSYKPRYL
jgi:predicted phage tail component-like protein